MTIKLQLLSNDFTLAQRGALLIYEEALGGYFGFLRKNINAGIQIAVPKIAHIQR